MDTSKENDALFEAVTSEDELALQNLLSGDKNIDVNEKDSRGNTPLIWASLFGDYNIARMLIEYGADPNVFGDEYNRWSPLSCAAFQGHLSIVQLLLVSNANVNATDDYGDTALMDAAKEGHTEVVKVLLTEGAEINARDQDGYTALHWAAGRGDYPETVAALISAGAEINLKDEAGDTALLKATAMGHFATVSTLINENADVNLRDNTGQTPLMKATDIGHFEIVSKLVAAGAKVSLEAASGETALSMAEEKASIYNKIVSVLLTSESAELRPL